MVKRRYSISRFTNVRQHERIEVETDVDLRQTYDVTEVGEAALSDFLDEHGEVLNSEVFDSADDMQLSIEIDEIEEVTMPESLPVPYPPTTAAQAEAWVRWAETEIGMGWHPDTPGVDLVLHEPIGLEARCACGETFNPHDVDDTVHGQREDGEPCGLRGMVVGQWGAKFARPLFPAPDVRARYDAGLAAAHELLPDIYATSMTIFKELHPELLPNEGKDTP